MLPLNEMLNNADNGRAMELLARQFRISQDQAQLAVDALLPAFSQGLKRNAADPSGLGSFLQAMSTGQHAKYFEDARSAFDPAGVAEGNGILGHLFGSKDLSRAVAAQASQATGLGQDLLKQMLPVLASMIMGGLFKQSTGQAGGKTGGKTGGGGGNPLTEIMEQMMRQGSGGSRSKTTQSSPFDNPLGKILEGMFGGSTTGGRKQDNPLGQIFEEMLGGGGARQQPKAAAKPKANPSGRARTPYDDLFGGMFETGAKTRDGYQQTIESVFDQFLQGMDKRGR